MERKVSDGTKGFSYDMVATGKRIRECRKRLDLSASELANDAGCYPGHLKKIEAGTTSASVSLMVSLARCLGTTVDYLTTGRVSISDEARTRIRIIRDLADSMLAEEQKMIETS